MEFLIGLAILGGVYALGRATSSAHGHLATATAELKSMAASLRERTEERELLLSEYTETTARYDGEVETLREENDAALTHIDTLLDRVSASTERAETAEAEAAERAAEVDALQASVAALTARAEAAETVLEETLGRAAGLSEEALRTAESFVAWCNRGTPLVGRYYLFERALKRVVPEAVVSPVHRVPGEGDGGALSFKPAASGAEYWLVRARGAHLLFPHPQSPDAFRELAPVFDGSAAPRAVTRVAPARLTRDGDRLLLDSPGDVS